MLIAPWTKAKMRIDYETMKTYIEGGGGRGANYMETYAWWRIR